MDFSEQDRARISAAIRDNEARTTGEIVCVLAASSSEHASGFPVLLASAVAFAVPWLLMAFTALSLQAMLSLQVLVFLALLAILCVPRVKAALLPRSARRALAHRVAMEQFVSRGIARTKERTGILIFVSLAERYARIIADEGPDRPHGRRPHRRRLHHRDRSLRRGACRELPLERSAAQRAARSHLSDLIFATAHRCLMPAVAMSSSVSR
jgi:uncharacterized membrane protein